MDRVKGKVAIVTGSGSGLGRAEAVLFAKEGAKVAVTDINDANGMETEFQAAFEELLWFINQDFSNRGLGDYEGAELQIVFNRDILINETESIENCSKSVGILSTETIVEQHPWVTDVEVELARLRKEKDEAMEQAQEYAGAFQTGNQNKGDNGEGE